MTKYQEKISKMTRHELYEEARRNQRKIEIGLRLFAVGCAAMIILNVIKIIYCVCC